MSVKNIVLIEDDEFFAKTFKKRLEKVLTESRLAIFIFESVEHALIELPKINPEIIFLDHFLNGMNGVDAIPELNKLLPKSEIVVVSSQKDTNVLDTALKSGASKYFRKDVLLMQNAREMIGEMNAKKSKFSAFWNKLG